MPIHWPEPNGAREAAAGPRTDLRGAILAAGLGRRLEPLTRHLLPKPMFPVGGKLPMLELWTRQLQAAGVNELCMNVCVLEQTIRAHFGTGSRLGVPLEYVHEPRPSGTLGGVCKQVLGVEARTMPGEKPLAAPQAFRGTTALVPSGDIVTNLGPERLQELLAIHREKGSAFTLVVTPIPEDRRKDFGTVVLDRPTPRAGPLSLVGRVERFVEKDPQSPSLLNNASIYLIDTSLLKELDRLRTPIEASENPFYDFGKHVFPALLGELPYARLPHRELPVFAVQYDGGWFDVGNKRDYLQVHRTLLDGELDVPCAYEPMPWGAIGTDVEIDLDKVDLYPPVILGHHCVVEPGATLGPYAVIGDGWRIGSGARVRDSVLWERYAFHTADGRRIAADERAEVDPHEVGAVEIRASIVAGGRLHNDVVEQTAQVLEDGTLELQSIDWVPAGPRA